MAKTDRALSGVFGVPELKSFGVDEDEPDMLPVVQSTTDVVEATTATSGAIVATDNSAQIDADTEYVKNTLKNLLGKGQDALETLIEIAKEEERASHFEALGGMINQLSNVAMGILEAENKRQKLKAGLGEAPQVVNNTQNNTVVFNGTTAELQAMLHQQGDVIDVQATEHEEEDE